MVFTFASLLSWLSVLGVAALGIVAFGLVGKWLGIFNSIWDPFSKLVDWVIAGFNALVFSAPTPLKIGIFVMLFSLLGAVVLPLTVGVKAVCSDGVLWKTDSFGEGFAANMLPSQQVDIGPNDPYVYEAGEWSLKGDTFTNLFFSESVNFTVSGSTGQLLVDSEDGYLALGEDGYSSTYAICYNKVDNNCYVKRASSRVVGPEDPTTKGCNTIPPQNAGDVVAGNLITVAVYRFSMQQNEEGTYYVRNAEFIKGLPENTAGTSDLTPFFDLCSGSAGDGLVEATYVSEPRALTDLFEDKETQEASVRVVGAYTDGVVDESKLDVSSLGSLQAKFLVRDGSGFSQVEGEQKGVIQYSCKGDSKDITLAGLPVFNPVFMGLFTIVLVLGMFIWGRR